MTIDFEQHRSHLRGVALRMLGSVAEADDALQEAWLRLERAERADVANARGWLVTVVARICLDMLRSRRARREEPLGAHAERAAPSDAERELLVGDSVGFAALVVLDRLEPAERVAFVLHDVVGMPFDEIATIVARSPAATRQLASRARRRVQNIRPTDAELAAQRETVARFVAALRTGDIAGLVAVLDPSIAVAFGDDTGNVRELTGSAEHVARTWSQGAAAFAQFADLFTTAVLDGSVGLVLAPKGRTQRALRFTFEGDRIALAEVIMDRPRLDALDIAALP